MTTDAPQYLHCLRSHASVVVQDRLGFLCQRLAGFFTIRADCVDYFVPESHAYLLYLIDANLRRQQHLDYIQ
jgi:hypothetical protein